MQRNDKELLEKTVNRELFHNSLSGDIGLYSGKMGFSIFLYHYSRFTGNKLFADFAEELINEVCESLYCGISISFNNGLSGIGWGLEYLAKSLFIEIDDNSVFEELNYKIQEINPEKMRDCSLATGIGGISTYVHAHISAARPGENYFSPTFIQSLDKRCTPHTDDRIWDEIAQNVNNNKSTWQYCLKNLLLDQI